MTQSAGSRKIPPLSTQSQAEMHILPPSRQPSQTVPHEPRIGAKLRHARLLQGHTLKELADIIGCSESMLSKLENERLTPSISFLHRLASALGTSIAELFAEADGPDQPAHHFPAHKRLRINEGKEGDAWFERILPIYKSGLLQANILNIPPGVRSDAEVFHTGEEIGYLIEGELDIFVDTNCYTLKQGDLLFFNSSYKHGYHNRCDTVARILWVNTPPSL